MMSTVWNIFAVIGLLCVVCTCIIAAAFTVAARSDRRVHRQRAAEDAAAAAFRKELDNFGADHS